MSRDQAPLSFGNKWQRRFDEYDAKNPHIYRLLVSLAHQVERAGKRCGIELLMNQVRWFHFSGKIKTEEPFKLNQNFAAYYARKIMAQEPDLKDFFELRRLRA